MDINLLLQLPLLRRHLLQCGLQQHHVLNATVMSREWKFSYTVRLSQPLLTSDAIHTQSITH